MTLQTNIGDFKFAPSLRMTVLLPCLCQATVSILIAYEGIGVVAGWVEGLLDGLRRGPADEVEVGACLVVGAAGTSTSEGLLSNDCSGGLVVVVDVAGCVFQYLGTLTEGLAVAGEDGAGESVGRGLVAEVEGLLVLGILIDIDGDDGSEDLFAHRLVFRGLGEDDGGLYEPAFLLVAFAAEDNLGIIAARLSLTCSGSLSGKNEITLSVRASLPSSIASPTAVAVKVLLTEYIMWRLSGVQPLSQRSASTLPCCITIMLCIVTPWAVSRAA